MKNGTYTAKYHVNNTDSSTVYSEFKVLNKVQHNENKLCYDWDLLTTGEFTSLEVENGYISVDYDSIEEAQLGKIIYFDTDTTGYLAIILFSQLEFR